MITVITGWLFGLPSKVSLLFISLTLSPSGIPKKRNYVGFGNIES